MPNSVDKLKTVADEAYSKYPKSCSHAVWHVIKQYLPDQIYLTANALLIHLGCDPRWKSVAVSELEKYVNEGILIVGGLSVTPNGHVVIVYPGKAKLAGGYSFTQAGKSQIVRSRGPYARVMSTSLGSWPGAMSNGDKTVWDPWGKDAVFTQVKFWRFDADEKKKPAGCK